MKPQYLYLDDIRYGKSTFAAAVDDLAASVNQGLMTFYDAVAMSKAITDNFRGQNFFASPRRAGLKLSNMVKELDQRVVVTPESPMTVQRIPETLLDSNSFTLQEIENLLGCILEPVGPDMPFGRAVVTTFEMPFAGNFLVGIHWGKQFDSPEFITKAQFGNFQIRDFSPISLS